MKSSISLSLIALFSRVVYGFSTFSPQPRSFIGTIMHQRKQQLKQEKQQSVTSIPASIRKTSIQQVSTGTNGLLTRRGGASTPYNDNKSNNNSTSKGLISFLTSLWGTGGVLYILAKAIIRVWPIALEPFTSNDNVIPLNTLQLGFYIATCIWFAYVEGYKGFQLKFSPLVVKRSFTLNIGKNGVQWYHILLAPLYSMGLIHATKKRKIVSWSVTLGVTSIVAIVKRLPYPYRNIIDAGVVTGLTWGSISIVILYIKSLLTGKSPSNIDAALP